MPNILIRKSEMKKFAFFLSIALLYVACAMADVPAYAGSATLDLGEPQFSIDIGNQDIVYLPLDELGRVTGVSAVVGQPSAKNKVDESTEPTGWHVANYEFIPGLNLYDKCYLLPSELGGAGNSKNVFTGTQYINQAAMDPIEDNIADYIRRTGNHVRYEAIPAFDGDNLLCSGIYLSAQSIEDNEISYHVFCYNVQPGVAIDYSSGLSTIAGTTATVNGSAAGSRGDDGEASVVTYVLNLNTRRFHVPNCKSVGDIKPKNRLDYHGTREEVIEMGYTPCKICEP